LAASAKSFDKMLLGQLRNPDDSGSEAIRHSGTKKWSWRLHPGE